MNRRRLLLIAALALSLLIAVIVILLLFWQRDAIPDTVTNTNTARQTNTTTTTTTNPTTADVIPVPTTIDRDDRQALTAAAISFTERFGSYSSDTHFENIERSRYLMTATMSKQADNIKQAGTADDQFSSVQSDVTSVTITDFTDGATGATVAVAVRQTQRVGQSTVTYQNTSARLTLQKQGDAWLIDSFRWL